MTLATVNSIDPAWHDFRARGIGGSDIAAILGISPHGSPFSVWAEKTGLIAPAPENRAMRLGKLMEPVIGQIFTEETGLGVAGENSWCVHPDYPWARCTVDGFVTPAPGTPLEADDPTWEAKFDLYHRIDRDEIPHHYEAQVRWQMFVTGRDLGWLAILSGPELQPHTIERDDDLIAPIVALAERFWERNVIAGVPPAPDGSEATRDALAVMWPGDGDAVSIDHLSDQVTMLRSWKAMAREADRDIDELENEIKAALGNATVGLLDGRPAITWKPQTSRRAAMRGKHDGVSLVKCRHTETVTTSRVMRLKPLPKEH